MYMDQDIALFKALLDEWGFAAENSDEDVFAAMNSNSPPLSATQLGVLQARLDANQSKLTKYNQLASALSKHQASLETSILTYRSLLTPVRNLPPDVLITIFHEVLASISDAKGDIALTTLQLSHVCSRWRGATLSSNRLWTTIDFCQLGEAGDRMVPLIQLCLARSGQMPLNVVVQDISSVGDSVGRSFALLASQCFRWSRVDIADEWFARILLQSIIRWRITHSLHHLRQLTLWRNPDDQDDVLKFLEMFRNAENLSVLDIDLGQMPRDDLRLQTCFPWSQLAKLTIHSPMALHLSMLFRACVNLDSAHIFECPQHSIRMSRYESTIRTLELDTFKPTNYSVRSNHIFRDLYFPALKNFIYRSCPSSTPETLPETDDILLSLFIHASQVESVTLLDMPNSSRLISAVGKVVPFPANSITSIIMHQSSVHDGIFYSCSLIDDLTHTPTKSGFFPKLENLDIQLTLEEPRDHLDNWHVRAVRMVQSRAEEPSFSPLAKFVFKINLVQYEWKKEEYEDEETQSQDSYRPVWEEPVEESDSGECVVIHSGLHTILNHDSREPCICVLCTPANPPSSHGDSKLGAQTV